MIRTRRPPLDDLLVWLLQACEGVAEAHRAGVIHRDLAPDNILVTQAGTVKVIDFGIAKLRDWGVTTTHEQHAGRALYLSPEVLGRAPAQPASDVYAMGLVIYEAVAGEHPIGDEPSTVMGIVRWHMLGEPRPLGEVVKEAPPDLVALVHSALDKEPHRRPTMRALAEGLRTVIARMRAPQRRAARNLPLPGRGPSLARTEAVARVPAPEEATPSPTGAPAPSPPPRPEDAGDRKEVLPSSAPRTLPSAALVGPPAPGERRSTGIPVEGAVARASTLPRQRPVATAAVVIAMGAAAAWWVLRGTSMERGPAPAVPPPSCASSAPQPPTAPPVPRPPASAPASPTASSAAPTARASAHAPPPRPAPLPRPKAPEHAPPRQRNRVFDVVN